jgi:hypothetical protein
LLAVEVMLMMQPLFLLRHAGEHGVAHIEYAVFIDADHTVPVLQGELHVFFRLLMPALFTRMSIRP